MKTKKFFSDDEKAILSNMPKNLRFIARDQGGMISVYEQKPTKRAKMWVPPVGSLYYSLPMYSHLFESVKWSNNVAYEFRNMFEV